MLIVGRCSLHFKSLSTNAHSNFRVNGLEERQKQVRNDVERVMNSTLLMDQSLMKLTIEVLFGGFLLETNSRLLFL
jgi:hypothetical protein